MTAVVLGEAAAVPGQGLEGGGPGLLAGLLAELGVVVGTDGAPVGERGHEAVDALLIAAELCGRVGDGDAALAHDGRKTRGASSSSVAGSMPLMRL